MPRHLLLHHLLQVSSLLPENEAHSGTKSRTLTTMTRTIGPAKLQIRGSWMEIQQKSEFP